MSQKFAIVTDDIIIEIFKYACSNAQQFSSLRLVSKKISEKLNFWHYFLTTSACLRDKEPVPLKLLSRLEQAKIPNIEIYKHFYFKTFYCVTEQDICAHYNYLREVDSFTIRKSYEDSDITVEVLTSDSVLRANFETAGCCQSTVTYFNTITNQICDLFDKGCMTNEKFVFIDCFLVIVKMDTLSDLDFARVWLTKIQDQLGVIRVPAVLVAVDCQTPSVKNTVSESQLQDLADLFAIQKFIVNDPLQFNSDQMQSVINCVSRIGVQFATYCMFCRSKDDKKHPKPSSKKLILNEVIKKEEDKYLSVNNNSNSLSCIVS